MTNKVLASELSKLSDPQYYAAHDALESRKTLVERELRSRRLGHEGKDLWSSIKEKARKLLENDG